MPVAPRWSTGATIEWRRRRCRGLAANQSLVAQQCRRRSASCRAARRTARSCSTPPGRGPAPPRTRPGSRPPVQHRSEIGSFSVVRATVRASGARGTTNDQFASLPTKTSSQPSTSSIAKRAGGRQRWRPAGGIDHVVQDLKPAPRRSHTVRSCARVLVRLSPDDGKPPERTVGGNRAVHLVRSPPWDPIHGWRTRPALSPEFSDDGGGTATPPRRARR